LTIRRYARVGTICVLVAVTALAGWRSVNSVTKQAGLAAGVFAAAGAHLAHGRVLYSEVWDHKPPVIHALNGLALRLGGVSMRSIRVAEHWMLSVGALLFFLAIHRGLGNPFLAFAGAAAFLLHFTHPASFQFGNQSEEYGGIFSLGGIVFALFARQQSSLPRALLLCAASGIVFSLAVLTKEPFLLSACVWFLYLLTVSGDRTNRSGSDDKPELGPSVETRSPRWRRPTLRAVAFVAGGLLPFGACVLYLWLNGALDDWIDVLHFNLAYSDGAPKRSHSLVARLGANFEPARRNLLDFTVTCRVAFAAGVLATTRTSFLRKYGFLPLFACAAFVADYCATAISEFHHAHYYLIPAASFILVSCCGVAFLLDLSRRRPLGRAGILSLAALSLLLCDRSVCVEFARRLQMPFSDPRPSRIADYIRAHTDADDPIWCSSAYNARYYVLADRLSPIPYYYVLPHLFIDTPKSTGNLKMDSVLDGLEKHRPKFIVLGSTEWLNETPIQAWIEANYEETSLREKTPVLWRLKAAPGVRSRPVEAPGSKEQGETGP
jgi:hypothetical protein